MRDDDTAPVVLSIISLTALTFALGIVLVPVWSPEVIPVLAALSIALTLFAQLASLRNAFRRREFFWMPAIILLGPIGVLSYGLVKATESGAMASYMDELARQTLGDRERP